MSNNIKIDDREKIEKLKQDYSRQYQLSKREKMLNSCSPADRQLVSMLQQLDVSSGGRLQHLYAVYMAIKSA
jgi:hypothetical protein